MSAYTQNLTAYEDQIARTRDQRMAWWRKARFGMFIHYGLYSVIGRHEWAMSMEGIDVKDYEKAADCFHPKEGCCREWVRLAKQAGMKYAVLTTRHHEGFSLWDSAVNPYNSVNYGPHRDIVREFVDACREEGLWIGFYSSLMDWHHPDGARCADDLSARRRFLDYIEALNTELLTQYGKIDILWYDVPDPMVNAEEWDSLMRNQRLRALQPEIIINDRSRLPEDFGTPEGQIRPQERDWEACMTFNDISWGYLDEEQSAVYAYNAPRILRMLCTCSRNGGNLLLNIGPAPDGSVPKDAVMPLRQVGEWLRTNGEAVYGPLLKNPLGASWFRGGNGITGMTCAQNKKAVYLWNWITPPNGDMFLAGFDIPASSVVDLSTGREISFDNLPDGRIHLMDLRRPCGPVGVALYKVSFDQPFGSYRPFGKYPQITF